MCKRIPLLLLPLLAGCFWLPRGGEEPYRITLEQVERAPAASATPAPAGRGFSDSLIAFNSHATLAGIHFRLRNRSAAPMTVHWEGSGLVGAMGEQGSVSLGRWIAHGHDQGPPDVVLPGRVIEDDLLRVVTPRPGAAPRAAWLLSGDYDPASRRIALRLPLDAGGTRYVYTFWYRVTEVRPDS